MESTEKDYSTLGSVAALIEQTLRHYQCEPAALFLKAGIDIEHIRPFPGYTDAETMALRS